jgi:hypothetical protein
MALTPISDMAARAQARVLSQYQGATARLVPWVGGLGGVVQTAESAVYGLLAQLDVATATGLWLERLGALVDEARESLGDAQYRAFIQARVLANGSQGRVEDIYSVARAGLSTLTYAMTAQPPAALQLVASGTTTDALMARLGRLLARTRAAGVRLSLLYQVQADAATFTFASGTALEASATLGFGDSGVPATGGGLASAANA